MDASDGDLRDWVATVVCLAGGVMPVEGDTFAPYAGEQIACDDDEESVGEEWYARREDRPDLGDPPTLVRGGDSVPR